MELVDTRDLKSLDRNIVPVQVRPRVPHIMKKNWLVATYKINEVRRVESNLLNQKFHYCLPKITTKKINSNPKVEVLFPGYIFINTSFENYLPISNTIGIKDIIKFGNYIPCLTDDHIKSIEAIVESSKSNPKVKKIEKYHKQGKIANKIKNDENS